MSADRFALDRRAFLHGTACTSAAALIAGMMPGTANAAAPLLGPSYPGHYRFKLGGFEITTVADGASQFDGPFPLFGENASEAAVQTLMEESLLPKTRLEVQFTPVMVNTGKELILFDTGNGPGRRAGAGLLASNMEKAGYKPDQVDLVVITHGHGDHIGGLMTDGKPAFPNAAYAIGNTEYKFWTAAETQSGPAKDNAALFQKNVVPLAAKMRFLEPGNDLVPGIRVIEAFGHTPGHLAFHIESEGKRMLAWADGAHHAVISLQQPDWHLKFDMDKAKAAESRKKLYEMAAVERIPVNGFHMPFPGFGFVEKKDSAFRWVPASYQLKL